MLDQALGPRPIRAALLMNFVAPYRVPLFERLRDKLGEFRVMISTPMESDRAWVPDWGTLDVVVQRNVTLRQTARDPSGFSRRLQVHIPWDTVPLLLAYAPDVVISVELGPRTLQAVAYKMLRPRTPLVVWCLLSEHSERGWGLIRRTARRWILRWADGVLVNGESGARYVARFGVPDSHIFRINQPVDVARFAAVAQPPRQDGLTRLLNVGMLVGRKGVVSFATHLIGWAMRHPGRQMEIWWLGDGMERGRLERLPWPGNLRPKFLGNLPYDAVPGVYADCDMLVFPTLLDEWGLVVNEAMAVGLPVLGSIYSQAVEELVAEGETGWVFDPLDEASVLAGLDRALGAGPEQIAAMGALARQRIARLTPDTAAGRINDAVRWLAGQRRGRRPGVTANVAAARP